MQHERQPHAEAAKVPGELGRVVREVGDLGFRGQVLEVVGADHVGLAKLPPVPHQEAAGPVRQEHPLVGIEGDRVRPVDPPEQRASPAGELEEPPVGAVHVKPQPLLPSHRAHVRQGIHPPRVGRSGAGHNQERPQAVRPVLLDHLAKLLHIEGQVGRSGDAADARPREPSQDRSLGHRGVRLVGVIQRAALKVLPQEGVASRDDGGEVRHRASRGEDPARVRRQTEQLAKPPDDGPLDLGEAGGGVPHVHETVQPACHEVRQGRRVQAAPGDERQVPGTGRVEGLGRPAPYVLENVREGAAVLGGPRPHRRDHLLHPVQVDGGRGRQVPDETDQQLEGGLSHGAHVIG